MIVVDIRLLAYPARNRRRSIPFGGGASFKRSCAIRLPILMSWESPPAPLSARSLPSSSRVIWALSPEIAGSHSVRSFPRRGRHDCGRLFLGRRDGQIDKQHSSPRRHHHCLFSFRHHHVSHEHACRQATFEAAAAAWRDRPSARKPCLEGCCPASVFMRNMMMAERKRSDDAPRRRVLLSI